MKIFYYIKRFWKIPILEKKLFIYAILLSTLLPIVLKLFPFKYYKVFLSSEKNNLFEETDLEKSYINIIRKTIRRVNSFSPNHLNCLIKGIIFKILSDILNLNYRISFAAIKIDSGNLIAHAYIRRGDKIIYLANKRFIDAPPLLTL
jgi:hypothetical protein